jgi:hypothetical protein
MEFEEFPRGLVAELKRAAQVQTGGALEGVNLESESQ